MSDTNSEKLANCPCCNGTNVDGTLQILCNDCGLGTSVEDTEEDALRVWNTRASGWQPIESAPKDGTEFISLSRKGICRCKWEAVDWDEHPMGPVYKWWNNPDDAFWFEEREDEPTHWTSLPAAPTTPQGEG